MFRETITFDAKSIAQALAIRQKDVVDLFTDGRPASFLIKRKVAHDKKWELGAKNAEYDWIDENSDRVECRILTEGGVSFAPNKMLGVKRHFDLRGFFAKLNYVKYYLVADVVKFPVVTIYKVSSRKIKHWYVNSVVSENGSMSYKKFYITINQGFLWDEGDD